MATYLHANHPGAPNDEAAVKEANAVYSGLLGAMDGLQPPPYPSDSPWQGEGAARAPTEKTIGSFKVLKKLCLMYQFVLLLFVSVFLTACVPRTVNMAIHQDDPQAVRERLNAGADPNGADDLLNHPFLFSAVASNKPQRAAVIRALLDAGAEPNLRSDHGMTPMHHAASAEAVNILLEYGADPSLSDKWGKRPVDVLEKRLITKRSSAADARREWSDPGVDALFEEQLSQLKAALQALGRTPITEEQSWEKYPDMMARLYPGGATPSPERLASTNNTGDPEPIHNNSGRYLSPYTSDGVVAEWVNKAINNRMGSATGSAVGGAAGAYAANKALESVPGGGIIGGFFGAKAGKAVGNTIADDTSGGDAYRRQTSDLSFHRLGDMAAWLAKEHGDNPNFGDVIKAANAVYPGLAEAINP